MLFSLKRKRLDKRKLGTAPSLQDTAWADDRPWNEFRRWRRVGHSPSVRARWFHHGRIVSVSTTS